MLAGTPTRRTRLIRKIRSSLPLYCTYTPTLKKPALKKLWFRQGTMFGTYKKECQVVEHNLPGNMVTVEYMDDMTRELCTRDLHRRDLHFS